LRQLDTIEVLKHTIKTFGIAREILGGREVVLETSSVTVGDLRRELLLKYPELVDLRSLFIAVNLTYADDNALLAENDEIALIPPVSGG
jgi:molybdopterin converting factor subunit 1